MAKTSKRSTKRKSKLPSVKSLEAKLWLLCKQIIRAKYPHVCVSCGNQAEGKSLHVGHFFRKKFIPMQMKYDMRLLRLQCAFCNLRRYGNLEWYTVYLLKNHPKEYILEIADDIIKYKSLPMTVPETRDFLQICISEYTMLYLTPTLGGDQRLSNRT